MSLLSLTSARWTWGVLCWGYRLTAGFADVLRHRPLPMNVGCYQKNCFYESSYWIDSFHVKLIWVSSHRNLALRFSSVYGLCRSCPYTKSCRIWCDWSILLPRSIFQTTRIFELRGTIRPNSKAQKVRILVQAAIYVLVPQSNLLL